MVSIMSISRVFAVAGYSKTGKTTLLERITPHLKDKGYSVAIIKSTQEDVEPPEGTDTRRHWDSGADPVILYGPQTTVIRHKKRIVFEQLIASIKADFILVEGLKHGSVPRVFCVGNSKSRPKDIPNGVLAIITWDDVSWADDIDIEVITSSRLERIIELIESRAMTIGA